jgi:hypothetical protein
MWAETWPCLHYEGVSCICTAPENDYGYRAMGDARNCATRYRETGIRRPLGSPEKPAGECSCVGPTPGSRLQLCGTPDCLQWPWR